MNAVRTILIVFLAIGCSVFIRPIDAEAQNRDVRRKPGLGTGLPKHEPALALINRVKQKYGNLTKYTCTGTNQFEADFPQMKSPITPFRIEYERGKRSLITWKQNDVEKKLTIDGHNSVFAENSTTTKINSAREGLGLSTMADGGWSLFLLHTFVFRDELSLGPDQWFPAYHDFAVPGEEVVDGRACYVLKAKLRENEGGSEFYIDKESYLIRRIIKTIIVRTQSQGKEFVGTSKTTENYSDIEIR
jgi:hypothetical protein